MNQKEVFGHSKIVYTWPVLLWGIVMVLLKMVGLEGEWSSWVMSAIICLILTTLAIDISRNAFLVMSGVLFLLGLVVGLVAYLFSFDLLSFSIEVLGWVGPYFLVVIHLGFLWVADYANTRLNLRFLFEQGEFIHKKWRQDDDEYRLESCEVRVIYRDWLEVFLWGGDIEIKSIQNGKTILITNVWNHQIVYQLIRMFLPSDRSDRGPHVPPASTPPPTPPAPPSP